jgi:hypothetical protein
VGNHRIVAHAIKRYLFVQQTIRKQGLIKPAVDRRENFLNSCAGD